MSCPAGLRGNLSTAIGGEADPAPTARVTHVILRLLRRGVRLQWRSDHHDDELRAFTIAPEIGLLLPCNVVVREVAEGTIRVETVNARMLAAMFPPPELSVVADEADRRLSKAIDAI